MEQLRWLNGVLANDSNVTILVTHDGERFATLAKEGLVGSELIF
jgi:ABC-type sulfate/molybdate transport systems ATPase subunit